MNFPGYKMMKTANRGKGNSNLLKSLAAVALMGALAFFSNSYFEGMVRRTLISASSIKPSPASAATQTPAQTPPAPSVVGHVVTNADLALGREYIGRVDPIQTVMLRPRIQGQIESAHFKEGSIVKEGDLLFTIDSAQYQATVQLRRADLSKAEASLSRAVKYNDRLKATDKRSVSASDVDIAASDVQQGKAMVEQARAALRLAQIDLDFTKIKAPITGRIGRIEATKGNYVSPGGAPLASIVQTDPIRVSFAMPDRDYMEQVESLRSQGGPVYDTTLTLADGTKYRSGGERDFEDSTMDSMTGTITMHLRFENSLGTLIPGSMVRVETKPKKSRVSPVVPQEAILTDSSGDYVYVIDDGDVAHRRDVELGTEIGTTREVASGLASGERVVLRGQQNERPESPVKPTFLSTNASDKSPADLARESGYDLESIGSSQDVSEQPEGTN
ncbi:MAG: efflux RND transporter periplasmic adaptor subunit [Synergistaceae bacterium]|nr:efflux RND transporter periplasmic adaptor subunit [Synergistaceae bacterium]